MPRATERPIRLEAAAGGAGGSWYVLLEGLARLVRDVHPWIDLHVVEGGGVMNHADVGAGRIPVAILNPPMTVAARTGRAPFDRHRLSRAWRRTRDASRRAAFGYRSYSSVWQA